MMKLYGKYVKYADSSIVNEYVTICRGIAKAKFENEEIQIEALSAVLYCYWVNFGDDGYRKLLELLYKEYNL